MDAKKAHSLSPSLQKMAPKMKPTARARRNLVPLYSGMRQYTAMYLVKMALNCTGKGLGYLSSKCSSLVPSLGALYSSSSPWYCLQVHSFAVSPSLNCNKPHARLTHKWISKTACRQCLFSHFVGQHSLVIHTRVTNANLWCSNCHGKTETITADQQDSYMQSCVRCAHAGSFEWSEGLTWQGVSWHSAQQSQCPACLPCREW